MEWKTWIVSALGTVILAAIIRAMPAHKLLAIISPWADRVGIALSRLLLSWLPRPLAERAEDGIICTAIDVVVGGLLALRAGLVKDNEKRLVRQK